MDVKEYLESLDDDQIMGEKIDEILEFTSTALKEGADPHDTLQILIHVTNRMAYVDTPKRREGILKLLHEHEPLVRSDADRATCTYILMIVYDILGIYPKVVESGLKLVGYSEAHPMQRWLAYSELSKLAYKTGMHKSAYEFVQKALKILENMEGYDTTLYLLNTYNILVDALSWTSRNAEYRDAKSKLLEMLHVNVNYPGVSELSQFIFNNLQTSDIRMLGFTRERAETYVRQLEDITKRDAGSLNAGSILDSDLYIFERMMREGMFSECAHACRLVLENPDVFFGDLTGFYELVESLCEKDKTLFTQAELEKYSKLYIRQLKDNAEQNRRMADELVREEYRIYDIDNA